MRRLLAALPLAATTALALAACVPHTGDVAEQTAGVPYGYQPPAEWPAAPVLVALDSGDGDLRIVTWGSSSCPPEITDEHVVVDGIPQVSLTEAGDAACTDDLAPTTHLIPDVLEGISPEHVDVTDEAGTVTSVALETY